MSKKIIYIFIDIFLIYLTYILSEFQVKSLIPAIISLSISSISILIRFNSTFVLFCIIYRENKEKFQKLHLL